MNKIITMYSQITQKIALSSYNYAQRWFYFSVCSLVVIFGASAARADSTAISSTQLFGFNMHDVATQVSALSEQHSGIYARNVSFSRDGNQLAAESEGEKINIWEWRNHSVVKTLLRPPATSTGSNAFQFSPDGSKLVSCQTNNPVLRVWNTADWSVVSDIADSHGQCHGVSFTRDGRELLYLGLRIPGGGDTLVAHSLASWTSTWGVQLDSFMPEALSVSPNGKLVAVAGIKIVLPVGVSDPVERFRQTKQVPTINLIDLQGHAVIRTLTGDASGALAWNADGSQIAIAGRGFIETFNVADGSRIIHEEIQGSAELSIRYSADGRFFIECDYNETGRGFGVNIWDGNRKRLLQHIAADSSSIDLSRDGKYLAIGEKGRTSIWELK